MADLFIEVTVSTPYDTDEYPVEYRILGEDRQVLYDWQASYAFPKPDTDKHPVIYVQARQQLDNDIMCINEKEFELVPQPIAGGGNVFAVTVANEGSELHAFTLNYLSDSGVGSEYGWDMQLSDIFGDDVSVNEMISHEGMLFIAGQMSDEGFIGVIDPGGNVIWQQSYSERQDCVAIVVYDDILWASFETEGYNGRISKIDLQTGVEDDGVMLEYEEVTKTVNPRCLYVGVSGVYAAGGTIGGTSSTIDAPFWRLDHNLEEKWTNDERFHGGIGSLAVDEYGGRLFLGAMVANFSFSDDRIYKIHSIETGNHIMTGPDNTAPRNRTVLFYQDKWVFPYVNGGIVLVEPGGDVILEENIVGPESSTRLAVDMQGNVLIGNSTQGNDEGPTYFPVYNVAAEELVDTAIRPEFEERTVRALTVVGGKHVDGWSGTRIRAEAQWSGDTDAAAGQITLTPPHELDFGEVDVGDDVVEVVTIKNSGGDTISGAVQLSDNSGGAFSIISGSGNFTLDSGETREVVIRYTAQTGPTTGWLQINHDAGNRTSPIDYPLRGAGTDAEDAQISINPANELHFGDTEKGEEVVETLDIKNTGDSLLIGEVQLSDYYFSIISGGGDFALDPGESKEVVIRYTSAGGPVTAWLHISHNDPTRSDPIEYPLRAS